MQIIPHNIPSHLTTLIDTLRAKLRNPDFMTRHRVRPQDFTRDRQLTFPVIMLFILQKTIKSIQRHLHEFLDELACDSVFEPLTSSAVTHARAKLKHGAFIELNKKALLPAAYPPEGNDRIQTWRGHRLLGIDSSLSRLPNREKIGQAFGWIEVSNQQGATGMRYPQGRISVVYDLLNRLGLDARLESSRLGEVALAIEQMKQLSSGDVLINDRGFSGYLYFAHVLNAGAHFIGRCSTGSFLAAQEMFRLNQPNKSKVLWLHASADQKSECRRLGLPLKMKVRFLSVRLSTGELEVLITSLLDEALYPTEEFLKVYHLRWGHETYYLMLKSRLDLENFSGLTVEAVKQDFHATVLLSNLESLLSQPVQGALSQRHLPGTQPLQVNRANCYHALKYHMLDLLYMDIPAAQVIEKLMQFFAGSPVAVRPDRKVPPDRKKPSLRRSCNYQRRIKKVVF